MDNNFKVTKDFPHYTTYSDERKINSIFKISFVEQAVNDGFKFYKLAIEVGDHEGMQISIYEEYEHSENWEDWDENDCKYFFGLSKQKLLDRYKIEHQKMLKELETVAKVLGFHTIDNSSNYGIYILKDVG